MRSRWLVLVLLLARPASAGPAPEDALALTRDWVGAMQAHDLDRATALVGRLRNPRCVHRVKTSWARGPGAPLPPKDVRAELACWARTYPTFKQSGSELSVALIERGSLDVITRDYSGGSTGTFTSVTFAARNAGLNHLAADHLLVVARMTLPDSGTWELIVAIGPTSRIDAIVRVARAPV
jgi:hypothetical protein